MASSSKQFIPFRGKSVRRFADGSILIKSEESSASVCTPKREAPDSDAGTSSSKSRRTSTETLLPKMEDMTKEELVVKVREQEIQIKTLKEDKERSFAMLSSLLTERGELKGEKKPSEEEDRNIEMLEREIEVRDAKLKAQDEKIQQMESIAGEIHSHVESQLNAKTELEKQLLDTQEELKNSRTENSEMRERIRSMETERVAETEDLVSERKKREEAEEKLRVAQNQLESFKALLSGIMNDAPKVVSLLTTAHSRFGTLVPDT